ncbi:ferrochelatase [Sulfurivirga sp.]|uniref:ferrochelatase n=1 Tax=Sulfurivirga sp. TaxID=2614236 RepID=UPI0025E68A14|nr:ferrochelatase [Sulfurivirga sp.]
MQYLGTTDFDHGQPGRLGILITNLGTPDAPTPQALKPYLREFLSDPRVVEPPPARWLWKLILETMILTTRPKRSAEAYREIWGKMGPGSPLLDISHRQMEKLEAAIAPLVSGEVVFALGMRYGNPSIFSALERLRARNVQRLLVLPLYPQYAGATTGSTFDAVFDALKRWRWVPEVRTVNHYHDHPGYIEALAASIREYQAEHGTPDRLIFSYHGIPRRYWEGGDPYPCQCFTTTRLVREQLGLREDQVMTTFQSLFGKEEWVRPYTDETLKRLPGEGVKHVQVICPGFSADCLETIEEIDEENREYFMEAGGERYGYIPALNDRDDHIAALTAVLRQHLAGWPEAEGEVETPELLAARQQRARARGARR